MLRIASDGMSGLTDPCCLAEVTRWSYFECDVVQLVERVASTAVEIATVSLLQQSYRKDVHGDLEIESLRVDIQCQVSNVLQGLINGGCKLEQPSLFTDLYLHRNIVTKI